LELSHPHQERFLATTLQTFREYSLRFDIEESFLDDKSNGFELEATLYLTAQGTEVVAQGKRRLVDPHWFRGSSYLKIGWNWVKTALTQGWELFQTLILPSSLDPSPALPKALASPARFSETGRAEEVSARVHGQVV
jgi:hypothetical protein